MAAPPAYLHIETDDGTPTRVLELGATPVRVGRGIQCEVRINQVGLGDVQCTIRRRGDEWQVQPVGPPGRIWLDNRPTDQQRSLPVGSTLRVGRATLTIHHADPDHQGRGSFDAPITVNAEPVETVVEPIAPSPEAAVAAEVEPIVEPDPTHAEPTASVPEDRVKRWQSRLDQRDQWLKDRQSEKRWEARWKAAGETIRARADQPGTGPNPTPPTAPAPTSPPTPPPTLRSVTPGSRPPLASRSAPVRTFEPRPVFGHTRRAPDADLKADPQRVPVRPEPAPAPAAVAPEPTAVVIPRSSQVVPIVPVAWTQPEPTPPPVEPAALVETPTLVESQSSDFDDVESVLQAFESKTTETDQFPDSSGLPSPATPEAVPDGVSETGVADDRRPLAPEVLRESGPDPELEPAFIAVAIEVADHVPTVEPDPVAVEVVEPVVARIENEPSDSLAVEPIVDPVAAVRRPDVEVAPRVRPEVARPDPSVRERAEPRRVAPPADPAAKDWPSARAIFAAQGTRPAAGITAGVEAATGPSRPRRTPEPTSAVAPEGWTIPFALGWLPAAGLVLALGWFTVGLALVWVGDSASGNLAIRLATRSGGRSPIIEADSLPRSAWWRTTASHLAAWSIALERVNPGEDRTADARALEADARVVSPLGARARFVAEPVPGQEADGMATIRLGPTRDVVTLTAMGHRLRREGKTADALRAYQTAFETAATTPRSTLGAPVFVEDTPSRRYTLPHSTLLDPIARDMADAGDWSPADLSAVVPEFGPALLAVATALRAKHPTDADSRLELICRAGDIPLDPRFEIAEHRAAVAEALAERSRWPDAIAQYRRAIEAETRDLDRRVWWFNLAELSGKSGDGEGRNQAIENAKGADLSDEVTQRAASANQLAPEPGLSARNR